MAAAVAKRQFGIATRLYQSQRLSRDHLIEIAAHGFETVEVVSAPGHFEPSSDAAVADLQQWLAEAQLDLHAVAAPPPDGPQPWNAGALGPVEQPLYIARRISYAVFCLKKKSAHARFLVLAILVARDFLAAVARCTPRARCTWARQAATPAADQRGSRACGS